MTCNNSLSFTSNQKVLHPFVGINAPFHESTSKAQSACTHTRTQMTFCYWVKKVIEGFSQVKKKKRKFSNK